MAYTVDDVKRILGAHPLLHHGGYGYSRGDNEIDIQAEHTKLYTTKSLSEIITACQWIDTHFKKTAYINTKRTSYGLKHLMEHETRNSKGDGFYTTNGQFIAAMLVCGFKMKGGYNRQFNVDERSVKRVYRYVNGG